MLTQEEEEALTEILSNETVVREDRTVEIWDAILNGDLAELQEMMK